MKFTYKIFGLFLLLAVAMTSCKKDIIEFNPNQITPPDFGKMVNADFGGEILDESGQPMKDVTITIGTASTTTDKNGIYLLRNVLVSERKAYVQATKADYFNGSRTMIVQEGKLHYANIQLLEKAVADTFEASDGGTVEFQGVTLDFPADGIKLKDGGSYSGTVTVLAKHLAPDDNERNLKMPGDLRGLNSKGEEIVMATFGMSAIELVGAGGEELQVADGATVEMSTTLPASFASLAPQTIPLWFFDEVTGLWQEEGEAVLEGDKYVGSVSHFTWWNNDFPYESVDVKGQIVDEDGNPIADLHVNIRVVGDPYGGHGNTNADGFFCGGMPKGRELELTIVGNSSGPCGSYNNPIFILNIGTFTEAADLGQIVFIPNTSGSVTPVSVKVSGRLVDCDGNPVLNGYVRGNFGRRSLHIFSDDTDGTFETTFIVCSAGSDLNIQGFDIDNLLQTDLLTFLFDTNIETGDMKACDQLDEYINYELDGNAYSIPFPQGFPEGDWTYVYAELDSFVVINFSVNSRDVLGTFPIVDFGGAQGSTLRINEHWQTFNVAVDVTFTNYPLQINEFFIGKLSGTFDDVNGDSHTLSGDFRIRRKD